MQMTLDGNLIYTGKDIAKKILKQVELKPHCGIDSSGTKMGFIRQFAELKLHNVKGFYFIYRNEIPVYVGFSLRSVGMRLNRWVSRILGTQLDSDDHFGARMYRWLYGKDLDQMSIKIFTLEEMSILLEGYNVSYEEIELPLIELANPTCNTVGNKKDIPTQEVHDALHIVTYSGNTLEDFYNT